MVAELPKQRVYLFVVSGRLVAATEDSKLRMQERNSYLHMHGLDAIPVPLLSVVTTNHRELL